MINKKIFAITLLLLTFLPGLVIPGSGNSAFANLYINEFMADNDHVIEDPDEPGAFEDWIEIYNSGDSIADMGGMYLTDDPNDPTQWQIPQGVTISAGGYLIFWADNDEEQGDTHTNFGLSRDGEKIMLFGANGVTLIDSIAFGAQTTDVSYGRYPDGADNWTIMAGTPGSANSLHTITGTTHDPVSPDEGDPVWVTCKVSDDNAIASVRLIYNAGSGPVDIAMYDDGVHHDGGSGDDLFGAQIPSFAKGTRVEYYITATDHLGAEVNDPIAAPAVTYYYIVGYEPPLLFINEFMADNDSTIEDPNEPGAFEDWIEIYNPGNSAVDMGGMYLTDDPNNPTRWQIPSGVTIPAGGYLIFWADNDAGQGQGDTHTNFGLAAGGEKIMLFGADGVTLVDSVVFDEQLLDVAYGRYPDGADNWGFMAGTPGAANSTNNPPPTITGTAHAPVSPAGGEEVWVTCTVIDDSAVDSVVLTYIAGSNQAVEIPMRDDGLHHDGGSGDSLFGAKIPGFVKDTIVDYYVTVTDDVIGLDFTDPVTAPVLTYFYIVGYEPPPLFINEFMADNEGTIKDPDDDPNRFEDWIEIYNAGDAAVDMGGMCLSDDLENPAKWQIPAGVTIPAGGCLLFWADNDEEQGDTHAGFALNKERGEIGLFDTNAKRNMSIDTMTYGEQPADISCGRIQDGKDPWVLSKDATPGDANAFPLGTHPMIWTFSLTTDSHILMKEMGDCVSAVKRYHAVSDKLEVTCSFWGRPTGRNFSIEPGESYIISITSPCSFSFE